MKRIFPNQAEAIANALYAILVDKKRASRILDQTVEQHPKWGARDRNLFYDAVYSILRWKIKYSAIAGLDHEEFQPWSWIKTWCIINDILVPDWDEMNCPPTATKENLASFQSKLEHVNFSFPDWLHQVGKEELGNQWENEMKASNTKAAVSLRVNRILTAPQKLASQLKEKHQIETFQNPDFPDTLYLPKGKKLNKNLFFRKGFFEIQDANSQQIAPFCQVKRKMNVIDLCAGAGGKTLHLAALMHNEGKIRAFDIEENKLKELNRRAKRAKVSCIETALLTNQVLASHKEWANVVLIDAPCSGMGTLKRNPEIKWNLTPERLEELKKIQRQLLEQAASLIQPDGKIIYATCSILPSENQGQTAWFLAQYPEFKLEDEKQILAQDSHFDGFYMARLGRA